jgi:hypothetical protein
MIIPMIKFLALLAVGVAAETSKPNTGDQTLGKSPPYLTNKQDSYSDSQPHPS